MTNLVNFKTDMNKKLVGSGAIILAVMLYGLYGVYSRLIGIEFGAFAQNYCRSAILSLILISYFAMRRKEWRKIEKKDIMWLIFWILPSSVTMILLFVTFNNLAIGTSYFLFYSTMVVGGFITGKIFFGERLSLVKAISLIFALIGLGIIYSSSFEFGKIVYVFFALISGLLTGIWNTLSKKVSGKYPELELVFLNGFFAFVVSVFGGLLFREPLLVFAMNASWFWIFLFAITQIAAIYLLVLGFKNLEAQIGSLIMPLEVIFAALFGFLFFGEILPAGVYLGGIFIALAAFLPNIYSIKEKYVRR